MKKAVVFLIFSVASISCNVSVDKQNIQILLVKQTHFLKKQIPLCISGEILPKKR
jgi:hypothetical protein